MFIMYFCLSQYNFYQQDTTIKNYKEVITNYENLVTIYKKALKVAHNEAGMYLQTIGIYKLALRKFYVMGAIDAVSCLTNLDATDACTKVQNMRDRYQQDYEEFIKKEKESNG